MKNYEKGITEMCKILIESHSSQSIVTDDYVSLVCMLALLVGNICMKCHIYQENKKSKVTEMLGKMFQNFFTNKYLGLLNLEIRK